MQPIVPSSSAPNPLGYYVYRFIDPRNGESFYVGFSDRASFDVTDLISDVHSVADYYALEARKQAINAAGEKIQVIVHRHGLSSKVAVELRAALMDVFLTASQRLPAIPVDWRGAGSVAAVRRRLEPPIDSFSEKTLLVRVSPYLSKGSFESQIRQPRRMDLVKSSQAKLILALVEDVIVEVFLQEAVSFMANPKLSDPETTASVHALHVRPAPADLASEFAGKRVAARFVPPSGLRSVRYSWGKAHVESEEVS